MGERDRDTGIWMRLGDGVTGSVAFIGQLALALGDARLLDGENPLKFAGDALRFADDPWELATRGLRRLVPITIALDEVDRLDDEAVYGLIRLVANLPDLRVRATTRTRGPLSEPMTALTVDVDIVAQEDLLLTAPEAAAILGHPEGSAVVKDVLTAGGGAPALARMIALARPRRGSHPIQGAITRLESAQGEAPLTAPPTVAEIVDSLLRARSKRWPEGFVEFIEVAAIADGIPVGTTIEIVFRADIDPAVVPADCVDTDGRVACLLDRALAVGDSVTVRLVVAVGFDAPPTITNVAAVESATAQDGAKTTAADASPVVQLPLPGTGGVVPWAVLGLALALLIGGGLIARRRRVA